LHLIHVGALVFARKRIAIRLWLRLLAAVLILGRAGIEHFWPDAELPSLLLFFVSAGLLVLTETFLEHSVREWRSVGRRARRLSERAFAYGSTSDESLLASVPTKLRDPARRRVLDTASPTNLAGYFTAAAGTAPGPERRRRTCLESAIYTSTALAWLRKVQVAATILVAVAVVITLALALSVSHGERLFMLTAPNELLLGTLGALALRSYMASGLSLHQIRPIIESLKKIGVLTDAAAPHQCQLVDELAWEYEVARIEGPEVPSWVYKRQKRVADQAWDEIAREFQSLESNR
jgi:hypothetical protein